MGNRFNRNFSDALASKLALQDSKASAFRADANLRGQQAGVVGANSRSAIDLNAANAADVRVQSGLRGGIAQAGNNLRNQQARTSRIGTNIDVNKFGLLEDTARFRGATGNIEGGGIGGVQAVDYGAPEAVDSYSAYDAYDAYDPNSGDDGNYGSSTNPFTYADGGEVSAPAGGGVVPRPAGYFPGFADGGEVGGPDPMMADYELYREAAGKAGVAALPAQEAIPRMAQIRTNKRQSVMDMISKGGTAPQGYADGGEISGPGTGKSDSIPAVIDGTAPAAVSDGEFQIPRNVVEHFGTKMFDALIEKARMAGKLKGRRDAAKAGA